MPAIERAAPSHATVLQVRFTEIPEPNATVLMRFQEPYPRVAACSALPPVDFGDGTPTAKTPRTPGELLILQVDSGAESQWRAHAEKWMAMDGSNGAVRPVHLKIEGGVVLWSPGLAVVQATSECLESILPALVDFAFYEGELRKLELDVAADWPKAEADVPLVHHVAKAELARTKEVGLMTALVVQRRLRCARLSGRLVHPPSSLGDAAYKLASRLRDEADVESRLEIVDGQIEVYEYQYEMINQRISDYSHFRHEYIVEIVIVVLLAAELIAMSVDLLVHM